LDEGQSSLLRGHMDHCTACTALVASLANAAELLPAMAEVNPGPWFTQRVMRATAYTPRRPAFDLHTAWVKLMHRPRIALEAAYLGAAAGLMGIYLPLPRPSLSLKVPAWVQPLDASAQRMTSEVIDAEHRASAALHPIEPLQQKAHLVQNLWQKFQGKARAELQALRSPHSTLTKGEEKKPPPANP